nr:LysR family transcriptional regulator [Kistimonas asteriae]
MELIRIFIQVVESGSFSKAGAVLNMAPSSIARNIDNLEKQLNVMLFRRSTRQLLLTEEGHFFLDGAGKLLDDADHLVQTMNQQNDDPRGVLRVSVFESFGGQCVCPLLPEFLLRYPKVKLEIELDNRLVDMNTENVDLAIRIGRPSDSSLHARRLMENHTLLCAAPAYFECHGLPESPEAIRYHNCLLLSHDRQRHYWFFHRDRQHLKIPVQGNLTSKGGTPLLAAALGGAGLLLLSSWMLTESLNQNQLQICLPEWEVSQHEEGSGEIYIVYRGSKYPKPVIRAFIDFIIEKIEMLATSYKACHADAMVNE